MRLVLGSVLLVQAGPSVWGNQPLHLTLTSAFLVLLGLLLLAGLWSPLAGTFVALIEAVRILTVNEHQLVSILVGTMGSALAMLGPGRWSVDARLFGWKRIDAPLRHNAFIRSDARPTPPQS